MDYTKIITSLIPLLLVAMWWVIDSMNTLNRDVYLIKSHMAHLVTPSGEIVPSADNIIARQQLKEEIIKYINDIHVRLRMVEDCK